MAHKCFWRIESGLISRLAGIFLQKRKSLFQIEKVSERRHAIFPFRRRVNDCQI
jgi:hypothetical protein